MGLRTATVIHEYDGRQVQVGEEFEVEDHHVELMLGMGRIERLPSDKTPGWMPLSSGQYQTREMTAQPARRANMRKAR